MEKLKDITNAEPTVNRIMTRSMTRKLINATLVAQQRPRPSTSKSAKLKKSPTKPKETKGRLTRNRVSFETQIAPLEPLAILPEDIYNDSEDEGQPVPVEVPRKKLLQSKTEKHDVPLHKREKGSTPRRNDPDAVRNTEYNRLLLAQNQNVVSNTEPFVCDICITDCEIGEGVILHGCLHVFCRDCIISYVKQISELNVPCPHRDANLNTCEGIIEQKEIKGILTVKEFEEYLQKSLQMCEQQLPNTVHCRTVNCHGFFITEEGDLFLKCNVCKVIHNVVTVKNEDRNDAAIAEMIKKEMAMQCPNCKVVITKVEGCDAVQCGFCKLHICWATKGPRWGPAGPGDFSAGCKCRLNGFRCHPLCINCH